MFNCGQQWRRWWWRRGGGGEGRREWSRLSHLAIITSTFDIRIDSSPSFFVHSESLHHHHQFASCYHGFSPHVREELARDRIFDKIRKTKMLPKFLQSHHFSYYSRLIDSRSDVISRFVTVLHIQWSRFDRNELKATQRDLITAHLFLYLTVCEFSRWFQVRLLFKDRSAQYYRLILRQGFHFGWFCRHSVVVQLSLRIFNFKLYLIFDVRCKLKEWLCRMSMWRSLQFWWNSNW